MASNHSTVFPALHKARLESFLPEYEAFAIANNPTHAKKSHALTKWRAEKAKVIMKEPLFEELVDHAGGAELKDWEDAVRRYFTNHYNNKFLRATHRNHHATPTSSNAQTSNMPHSHQHGVLSQGDQKALQDAIRRSYILFTSEISARELYASENEDNIRQKMNELQTEYPNLLGGGLRSKALKVLWAGVDHGVWEARVREMENNVEANQADFQAIMHNALEELCSRNRLGSVLMSFSYAFRNPDSDGIKAGFIHTGFNAETAQILSVMPPNHQEAEQSWISHANAILPRKASGSSSVYTNIPTNASGVPILPQLAKPLAEISPTQIAVLLHDFLLAVWRFSKSGTREPNSEPIDWNDIRAFPEKHYDCNLFSPPVPIDNPNKLIADIPALYSLHAYLQTLSSSDTPFQFLAQPKNAIQTPAVVSRVVSGVEISEDSEIQTEVTASVEVDTDVSAPLPSLENLDTAATEKPKRRKGHTKANTETSKRALPKRGEKRKADGNASGSSTAGKSKKKRPSWFYADNAGNPLPLDKNGNPIEPA